MDDTRCSVVACAVFLILNMTKQKTMVVLYIGTLNPFSFLYPQICCDREVPSQSLHIDGPGLTARGIQICRLSMYIALLRVILYGGFRDVQTTAPTDRRTTRHKRHTYLHVRCVEATAPPRLVLLFVRGTYENLALIGTYSSR